MVSTGASLIWGIDANPTAGVFTGSLANSANIGNGKNAPFHIATNAIVRLTVDASGNLGLGVTPSAWDAGIKAFEIFSSGNAIVSSTSSQNIITTNARYVGGGWQYGSNGLASTYQQQSGVHTWNIAPTGTAGNAITFTQAMTLTSGGNLLVGTTTDSGEKLQVVGAAGNIVKITDGTSHMQFYCGSGLNEISTVSPLLLSVGGTERFRIASTGAATFSSSVTATSFSASSSANDLVSFTGLNTNNNASLATSTAIKLGITSTVGTHYGTFKITENTPNDNTADFTLSLPFGGVESTRLTIFGNGAATFSSSVTATSATFTNGVSNTQLTVNGIGAIKSGINFANGGTTYGQIYFDNNAPYDMSVLQQYTTGSLIFGTNNTERMRLDASGNLGLGVQPSAWNTYKAIQIGEQGVVSAYGSGAAVLNIGTNFYWDGAGYKRIVTGEATQYQQNTGEHNWRTAPSGISGAAITFTQAMTLTSNGNLLLNTTTDSGEKLQVNGNGTFGGRTIVGASYIADLGGVGNNCGILFGPGAVLSIDGTGTLATKNLGSSANPWGTVYATSFIKSGGTSSQYLMADGSVTTGGGLISTNRQTASYTLALTDADKLVEMNVATANNLTVPLNSSVAFAIGTKIDLSQYGAGQTTVVATSGVTVRSAGGALKLALQYSGASLVKIATNEWYLFGDITV
jgi:hypothetical protein